MTTDGNHDADNTQASSDSANEGIIYVLTNPAMQGLVKIGKTTQSDVTSRISQLYTTGVPLPFDCEYAVKVSDITQVENALHFAFGDSRVNPNREFFEIDPERVKVILDLLKIEDVTPGVQQDADESVSVADKTASDRFKSRMPNLNFGDLRIPLGAELKFRRSGATATVVDDSSTVRHEGEDVAISLLTGRLMESNYYVGAGPFWTYKGRLLNDLYNTTNSTAFSAGETNQPRR